MVTYLNVKIIVAKAAVTMINERSEARKPLPEILAGTHKAFNIDWGHV